MFDGTILKMETLPIPNSSSQGSVQIMKWTNESYSNLSNISGFAEFNQTIKQNLKYVYLNNNSFSNVNSLSGFSKIECLYLMNNLNLTNVDGLENHETIKKLLLHNCNLASIGTYNETTSKYSKGLTGCTGLRQLTLENNKNLSSLVGLDGNYEIWCLIAYECDLTDISSLKDHRKYTIFIFER